MCVWVDIESAHTETKQFRAPLPPPPRSEASGIFLAFARDASPAEVSHPNRHDPSHQLGARATAREGCNDEAL